MATRIHIICEGGLVTAVYTDDPAAEVTIIDLDCIEDADPGDFNHYVSQGTIDGETGDPIIPAGLTEVY